jgi:hypothetical protein
MKLLKHSAFFLFCFISFNLFCGRFPPAMGASSRGIRFNFGPCIGFYKINNNHAQNPSAKMSALIGFKKEVRLNRSNKAFFLWGFDYFFHGVNFKSYYFKPDSLHLYDRNFAYNYSLFIQELNLPLQMKYSFTKENNSLYSPYVMIGYHLRFLLPANITVSRDGNNVKQASEDLQFRNSFIDKRINSFVSATAGWQKNTINKSRSGFFIEASVRYGFSQYFFQSDYSASSLYINALHTCLILGVKF